MIEENEFRVGGVDGDRIEIIEWGQRSVCGWKNPEPKVGDILLVAMRGGKVLRCRFIGIQPSTDQKGRGMFFGWFKELGYVGSKDFASADTPTGNSLWRKLWRLGRRPEKWEPKHSVVRSAQAYREGKPTDRI